MLLGTGALGERALDGAAVREALGQVGLEQVLLVARPDAVAAGPGSQLAGLPAAGVRCGWEQLSEGLTAARSARCTLLIVDLPRLMGLERACRALFDLGRRTPGLSLAVETPAAGPLSDPETLGLLFDDLQSAGVRWWHRPSRTHLSEHRDERGDGAWLDALGAHLAGFSLDDVQSGQAGLPPGLGEIDFAALAPRMGRSLPVALDVDPVVDVGLLRFTVAALDRAGLR